MVSAAGAHNFSTKTTTGGDHHSKESPEFRIFESAFPVLLACEGQTLLFGDLMVSGHLRPITGQAHLRLAVNIQIW